MSALDLFASAMGAFVLLAVMMLPYYHKGKDLEEQITLLEPQVVESRGRAEAAGAGLAAVRGEVQAIEEVAATDPTASEAALQRARARGRELEQEIGRVAERIEAKQSAAKQTFAPEPDPVPSKVTFRFLGLKTDAKRYLVLVDGSARIKERAPNLPAILKSVVEVMGPQKEFALAFYRFAEDRLVYDRWPASGFSEGGSAPRAEALDFLRGAYGRMSGGSPTAQALLEALEEAPDSIILVSDGVIFPPHNGNRNWQQIVDEVTRANVGRSELNVVAIGLFSRNASFWTFLNELRKRNGGDLKAIPP